MYLSSPGPTSTTESQPQRQSLVRNTSCKSVTNKTGGILVVECRQWNHRLSSDRVCMVVLVSSRTALYGLATTLIILGIFLQPSYPCVKSSMRVKDLTPLPSRSGDHTMEAGIGRARATLQATMSVIRPAKPCRSDRDMVLSAGVRQWIAQQVCTNKSQW